jgi:uncharacterized membrane protein
LTTGELEKWQKWKGSFSTFLFPRISPSRSRVIFIDLARALAVVFMLYGHTVSALLASEYRAGTWFEVWTFQRGLTSSLFLLLSGFAFSIATSRHWQTHLRVSPALLKRVRRFGLFILLGYALHVPVARLVELPSASADRWQAFLAADVLQLIGVSFFAIQLLVLVTRSRAVFTAVALLLAVAIVALTPQMWRVDWAASLPLWAAAYLSPATGSQFPLFPWAAFVLVGVGVGQLYARWGASHLVSYATGILLLPGIAAVLAVLVARAILGDVEWSIVPFDVAMRIGASLIVLAAMAYASLRISRLPHAFGAMAQESLLIYFVHLCIVYGSIWNVGLAQTYGETLDPWRTVLWVLALIVSMTVLAVYWNWWKHVHPMLARWTSVAAGAWLLFQLR